jgi:hypothetical protein
VELIELGSVPRLLGLAQCITIDQLWYVRAGLDCLKTQEKTYSSGANPMLRPWARLSRLRPREEGYGPRPGTAVLWFFLFFGFSGGFSFPIVH